MTEETLADIMRNGLYLVINNRVKFISKDIEQKKVFYEVLDNFDDCKHNVIFKTLPGRTTISCDCKNFSRFCNESKICCHTWACLKVHEMRVLKIK